MILGSGIAGIAAAMAGADVTQTDYEKVSIVEINFPSKILIL